MSANDYLIAPSILSADFARLGEEVEAVLDAGADVIHFDVMDNHYVPNLTIGPLVCEALRKHGVTAPIDVHLMVRPVDRLVSDFAAAGATYISFHPEASEHVHRTIGLIRESGCKPGLVFNPATPLDYLEYCLPDLDLVLLMSVNPGFGGQTFIPSSLTKLKQARTLIDAMQLQQTDHVLDIGCGSGCVALAAACCADKGHVTAVDSNIRAIQCTQIGAELNDLTNITVRLDDEVSEPERAVFDVVLANPPYYSNYKIAELFLEGAHRCLKPGGSIYVVAKRADWYLQQMPKMFQHVEVVADRQFRVIKGIQP